MTAIYQLYLRAFVAARGSGQGLSTKPDIIINLGGDYGLQSGTVLAVLALACQDAKESDSLSTPESVEAVVAEMTAWPDPDDAPDPDEGYGGSS